MSEGNDVLTRVATMVEVQGKDIADIKAMLKDRPCPSGLCAAHSTDIAKLKYRNSIISWALPISLTVLGLAIAAVAVVG